MTLFFSHSAWVYMAHHIPKRREHSTDNSRNYTGVY